MRSLLALALLMLGLTASGASPVPSDAISIEVQDGHYWLSQSRFRLGYTALLLKSGYPIGQLDQAPPDSSTATTPEEMDRQLKQITSDNRLNQEKVRSSVTATLNSLNNSQAESPHVPSAPTSVEKDEFDFPACARSALLLLKQQLLLEHQLRGGSLPPTDRHLAEHTLAAIQTQLQIHRGQGGLPCARGDRFLDTTVLLNIAEQIKTLMTLLVRTEVERESLKGVLALAFDPRHPEPLRRVWGLVWLRVSLVATFSTKPLPTPESVAEAIDAATDSVDHEVPGPVAVKVRVTRAPAEARVQVKNGLQILKKDYGHNG